MNKSPECSKSRISVNDGEMENWPINLKKLKLSSSVFERYCEYKKNQVMSSSVMEIDSSSEDSADSEVEVLDNEENSDYLNLIEKKASKVFRVLSKKLKLEKNFSDAVQETDIEASSLDVGAVNSQQTANIDGAFSTIGQVHNEKNMKIKHSWPSWIEKPTAISVNVNEEFISIYKVNCLDSNTKRNLTDAKIQHLFPVQSTVIPYLMERRKQCLLPPDICVSAPTGSGKTLSFVIPIVQILNEKVVCSIRAVVVLPTSELAFQVFKVFEKFKKGTDLKIVLLTGQKSFSTEQDKLVKLYGGNFQSLADIIITTPGRLIDHIQKTEGFCLKHVRYLVIDEADKLIEEIQKGFLKKVTDAAFSQSFRKCIVCSRTRFSSGSTAFHFELKPQPLQKLLFSATLTYDPELLNSLSLFKPKLFIASTPVPGQDYIGACVIPLGLRMFQVICEEDVKPMIVCYLMKCYNFKKVLCFVEKVERAHRLHVVLEAMKLQVREISSLNQAVQRKIVLGQFNSGTANILVCSDLIARGMDIEDIDCVLSYDVPQSIKMYIHRIGRTARAGKSGTAITLLTPRDTAKFTKMLKLAGTQMPDKIVVENERLKPFVNSYQTALAVADAKLKEEK